MLYVLVGSLVVILVLMRVLLRTGPLRGGDLFKVAIPRTADRPLAMGTRMDLAAALKQHGRDRAEIVRLIDGDHDQELLDRYWAAPPPSA